MDKEYMIDILSQMIRRFDAVKGDVEHLMSLLDALRDEFPKESTDMYNYLNRALGLISDGIFVVNMLIAHVSTVPSPVKADKEIARRVEEIGGITNEIIRNLMKVDEIRGKITSILEVKGSLIGLGAVNRIRGQISTSIMWLRWNLEDLGLISTGVGLRKEVM